MKRDYPYPTPVEILRYMAVIFDIEYSKTPLKDMSGKIYFDPRQLIELCDELFTKKITQYVGRDFGLEITAGMAQCLDTYMGIVSNVDASGVGRVKMINFLSTGYANGCLLELLFMIRKMSKGLHPTFLLDSETLAVEQMIKWLDDNDQDWKDHYRECEQGERDKITSWRRGEKLPGLMSIGNIGSRGSRSRTLLFVARAIDSIRKTKEGAFLLNETRKLLFPDSIKVAFHYEVVKFQQVLYDNNKSVYRVVRELHGKLNPKKPKQNPELVREEINSLRALIKGSSDLVSTEYFADWLDARWHVFSGDINKANELYKHAVEKSLYRAGDQQEYIINEALLVASVKIAPDKVFIRELRRSQLLFGYESDQTGRVESSVKFEDWADSGELEIWQGQFTIYFPEDGLFPGVTPNQSLPKIGPMLVEDLCIEDPKLRKTKPDYRNPDRKIKVGDAWQRKVPQLVWFTRPLRDFDACEKLIEKGANVNVWSESGQTPIMAALENMDLTQLGDKEPDDRFFWLYSKMQHSHEAINRKTNKKRILPIVLAVDSGRVDVVTKVLSLGADPNIFGSVDNLTALMHCLNLIAMLKNPIQAMQKVPINNTTLDAIKRQGMGGTGFSKKHQQAFIEQMTEREVGLVYETHQLQVDQTCRKLDISVMREIAVVLIEQGANVDLAHGAMMGYTPMLLAAELNEADIFKLMLREGGDPSQTFYDEYGKASFNCWHLANHFNAECVREILDDFQNKTSMK